MSKKKEERPDNFPYVQHAAFTCWQRTILRRFYWDWIARAQANGTGPGKIVEARRLLAHIEEWRRLNPVACKIPN